MPVHYTGTLFIPEFHTGTYQYILYPLIFSHFYEYVGMSVFRFEEVYRHF
jgi:hypothetical protein